MIVQLFRRLGILKLLTWLGARRRLLELPILRRFYITFLIRLFNNGAVGAKRPGTIRMFALWASDGRYNWMRLAVDDPDLELLTMPADLFQPLARHYVRDYYSSPRRDVISTLDLYSEEQFDAGRQKYLEACIAVVGVLIRRFDVDLFLMPKIHDDWYVEMHLAFKQHGIPVMVTEREPVAIEQRLKMLPPIIERNIDFNVDKLCLASEHHRGFFVRGGFDPQTMVITGELKNDFWFRRDLWPTPGAIHPSLVNDRLKILFFSFGAKTYLYKFFFPGETRDWESLVGDVHREFGQFIQEHPDRVQLIYKTGDAAVRDYAGGAYADFQDKVNSVDPDSLLRLDNQYKALELLTVVDLIIGFQTTGLIEAMFTDRPIIYVAWGELFDDLKDVLLPLHDTQAIFHADSPQALRRLLTEFVANPQAFVLTDEARQARKEMREYYYDKIDGKAGERCVKEAVALVRASRGIVERLA